MVLLLSEAVTDPVSFTRGLQDILGYCVAEEGEQAQAASWCWWCWGKSNCATWKWRWIWLGCPLANWRWNLGNNLCGLTPTVGAWILVGWCFWLFCSRFSPFHLFPLWSVSAARLRLPKLRLRLRLEVRKLPMPLLQWPQCHRLPILSESAR